LQEVVEGRSIGVFEEDGIDLLVERLHVLLEGAEQRSDEAPDRWRRDAQAVLLGYDQGKELATASDQIGQQAVFPLHDRPKRRLCLLPEEGEEASIEGVGLGEHTYALAEAPHPPRVHDDDRKADGGELLDEAALVAAGRLDHDAIRVDRHQVAYQLSDGARLVAGALDRALGAVGPVEAVLRDVDSNRCGHGILFGATNSGSRIRARASGPGDRSSFAAAVERGPELVNGLARDPANLGLPLRVEEGRWAVASAHRPLHSSTSVHHKSECS